MARPAPSEQLPDDDGVPGDAAIEDGPWSMSAPPDASDLGSSAPIGDPATRELRYRYSRARRNARIRQKQETRLARYRFYIVMTVLIAIAVAFVVGSWHEIQRLFGL